MYSSDSAVLGASTVAAPAAFSIVFWPDLVLVSLAILLVVLALLFVIFRIRNKRTNN